MLQGLEQMFQGLQLLYQGLEHKFQALQQKKQLGARKFGTSQSINRHEPTDKMALWKVSYLK
jgi:hypothetical protein